MTLHVDCAPTPTLRRLLAARRLDLALVSLAVGEGDSEVAIRHEPLVWAAANDFAAAPDEPLQVALSDPHTLDHRAARAALEAAGRAYRVACESVSKDGLLAIVRAGIAVAVLTRGAVPSDLRLLGIEDTLPPLPSVGIAVASAEDDGESLLVAGVRSLMVDSLARMPA